MSDQESAHERWEREQRERCSFITDRMRAARNKKLASDAEQRTAQQTRATEPDEFDRQELETILTGFVNQAEQQFVRDGKIQTLVFEASAPDRVECRYGDALKQLLHQAVATRFGVPMTRVTDVYVGKHGNHGDYDRTSRAYEAYLLRAAVTFAPPLI